MRLNPKRRARRRQQLEIARNEKILQGPVPVKAEDVTWQLPNWTGVQIEIEKLKAQMRMEQYQVQVELYKAKMDTYQRAADERYERFIKKFAGT